MYQGPKSGEAGRVDMGPRLAARLKARRDMMAAEAAANGRKLSPWVFPALNDPTKPLNAKSLQNAWTRLLRQAGLRHIHIHGLRHTYASSQLQAGESIQYVRQQLRHSTIKLTVDLYGHLIRGRVAQRWSGWRNGPAHKATPHGMAMGTAPLTRRRRPRTQATATHALRGLRRVRYG